MWQTAIPDRATGETRSNTAIELMFDGDVRSVIGQALDFDREMKYVQYLRDVGHLTEIELVVELHR